MNVVLQIIIGFLLADIMSGFFHWIEDTYFDYCINIPILSNISKDNELHHYFPRAMLQYSYFENIYVTFILTCFGILLIYLCIPKVIQKYPFGIITFSFFSITSNILHRFSHQRECENNPIVTLLQKCGILCSHKHHSLHHTNIDEKYCVVTEYNNYILDFICFWRILEYIIYFTTGISPSRKMSYDSYKQIQNYMHIDSKNTCPKTPTKQDIEILMYNLHQYRKCSVPN